MYGRLKNTIRLLACVLIGMSGVQRLAHDGAAQVTDSTRSCHSDVTFSSCSHSESGTTSPSVPHDRDVPAHDAEHCAVCHLLAIGSTGVMTDSPARFVIAPPIDRRIPPAVVEPHSAEIALPLSARAPPVV